MSDTNAIVDQGSLIRRIFRTPLGQLLRGRLDAPPTLQYLLTAAALPAPIADLISRTTRHTRLWKSEQLAVAAELIAHFADGLDAGASADALISRFGDEHQAARLIRRAKRRNRPLYWHAWRICRTSFAAFLLFYALLAVYYYTGRPHPSVDYVAILNQPILATPEDQRAWPLYRQAIIELGLTEVGDPEVRKESARLRDARPGSRRWPALAAWLSAHQPSLALLERAGNRPHLGFILGPDGSAKDPALFPTFDAAADTGMYGVVMPALSPVRSLANLLAADMAAATESRDRARFLRDTRALLALADRTREHPSIVGDLVSIGIRALGYEQLGRTLTSDHVSMLTDGDLRELAHRLAGPQVAADFFDLEHERMFFHDAVQRIYSDGGPGGGRVTPEGFRMATRLIGAGFNDRNVPSAIGIAAMPATTIVVASRNEEIRLYDGILDQAQALMRQPLRDADWDAWDQRVMELKGSLFTSIRNYPIGLFLPSLTRMPITAERCLGVRDGLLCALALETYRRHHDGTYPASLAALTPGLLPSIPPDRIAGGPLHYTLVDGHPVIYSLGDDRLDDHGHSLPGKDEFKASMWNLKKPVRGDWVLYPRPIDQPVDD